MPRVDPRQDGNRPGDCFPFWMNINRETSQIGTSQKQRPRLSPGPFSLSWQL